ncbi:hypothetical protein R3P38DRAFT_2784442 [Favolaschia claudopus]|uniref:Uncharacterized protein n=1 Tax=Favolaschia claudopus TaxID=2862362 RepID=A0AAW0AW01_9AGAR
MSWLTELTSQIVTNLADTLPHLQRIGPDEIYNIDSMTPCAVHKSYYNSVSRVNRSQRVPKASREMIDEPEEIDVHTVDHWPETGISVRRRKHASCALENNNKLMKTVAIDYELAVLRLLFNKFRVPEPAKLLEFVLEHQTWCGIFQCVKTSSLLNGYGVAIILGVQRAIGSRKSRFGALRHSERMSSISTQLQEICRIDKIIANLRDRVEDFGCDAKGRVQGAYSATHVGAKEMEFLAECNEGETVKCIRKQHHKFMQQINCTALQYSNPKRH